MQHFPDFLCVHHELHEYDQDEDSSKACVPLVLLSHDVFTFRKVLVAIERMGGLSQRTDLATLSWLFAWRVGQHIVSIDQLLRRLSYKVSSFNVPMNMQFRGGLLFVHSTRMFL